MADTEAATAWYGETLGLPMLYAFPGIAFFQMGDVRLYLGEDKPSAESILYFRVDDIHAAHRQLEARGVAFANAPHMIHRRPYGTETWLAEFADPEGRPMALMCDAKPGTV